tara:strand:- start:605 stop:1126 length:522 start_codon:yes stop_codon:yes gene_type:complete
MDEIKEIKEWIVDYLEKPSDNFGGMPVCPFVKKERMTERLLIDVWKPDEKSFLDLLERLNESEQYTSALLICKDTEDIKWEEVDRKKFQKTIQVLMEDKGYKNLKALCFSPFEEHTAAGEETRKGSPYFLINIAGTKELNEAHRSLFKTKYFENFSEKEIKELKVYPKDKKVL